MLFQPLQCWLTWCLSPWKQAYWRGVRLGSWVEIRNSWRLCPSCCLSNVWGEGKPDASSNRVRFASIWWYYFWKQKHSVRVRPEKTHGELPADSSFISFSFKSLQQRQYADCVTELRELLLSAIDLHLEEPCVHESQAWTWLGGECRDLQFVIIWVTTCLTECSLSDLSLCFELITKRCVYAAVRRREGKREKWQRWGNMGRTREKQGFWVIL